ncbi:hypothetical protein SDC9_143189 [bioreactor metagenome]|uniref:Uncharacterized protein n=1 Tax=bioreactor metagenome TaxID=1076179 RepID=A0A645E5F0_9ZZZZ
MAVCYLYNPCSFLRTTIEENTQNVLCNNFCVDFHEIHGRILIICLRVGSRTLLAYALC